MEPLRLHNVQILLIHMDIHYIITNHIDLFLCYYVVSAKFHEIISDEVYHLYIQNQTNKICMM